MSTARHTPGPWQVATEAEIDGERMPDGSGGMSYTGRMVYDRRLGVCTKEDLEQGEYEPESLARPWNEADAYLIAAAPEMADALTLALIALGTKTTRNLAEQEAVEAIRAVLDKINGTTTEARR